MWSRNFFGSLVVRTTPHFPCRGWGWIPGWGTEIPQVVPHSQKKKEKRKKFSLSIQWSITCTHVQSYPTLCDPLDCSPPGSSGHGILQARTPEQVAISFSRGSSWPRDRTRVFCVSCVGRQIKEGSTDTHITDEPQKPSVVGFLCMHRGRKLSDHQGRWGWLLMVQVFFWGVVMVVGRALKLGCVNVP